MSPKLLLADDHAMIRKGVRVLCEHNLGISNIHETGSCKETLNELEKNDYTHLILDINFSDGSSLEIIPTIRRTYPELLIAVLTMQPTSIYKSVLKQFGVKFFISKEASTEDMKYFLRDFFESSGRDKNEMDAKKLVGPVSKINPRELEILNYWMQGIGTKEIAQKLGLAMTTVSTVKATIFRKTKTNNIIELKELISSTHLKDQLKLYK